MNKFKKFDKKIKVDHKGGKKINFNNFNLIFV